MTLSLSFVGVAQAVVPAVRPIVHRVPVARMSAVDDDACHLVRKLQHVSSKHACTRRIHVLIALLVASIVCLSLSSQATLDGYASSVFGKHYRMEGWICPEGEALNEMWADSDECNQVVHEGELVWACEPGPVGIDVAYASSIGAAGAMETMYTFSPKDVKDETLFAKLKSALPTLKLGKFFTVSK